MPSTGEVLLGVRETARRLGVHENTVRNWAKEGLLHPARMPGSRYQRFPENEVTRVAAWRSLGGDMDEKTRSPEECIGFQEKGPHEPHMWQMPVPRAPVLKRGDDGWRWCPGEWPKRDDDYTPEAMDRDALPDDLTEMVDDAVSRMKRELEARDREAIDWLIGRMAVEMSEAEAGESHAVLITDPSSSTGSRQVVGPYPDRLHAKIACVLLKAVYVQDDPEFDDLVFEPIIFFPDPLKERVGGRA